MKLPCKTQPLSLNSILDLVQGLFPKRKFIPAMLHSEKKNQSMTGDVTGPVCRGEEGTLICVVWINDMNEIAI